MDSSFQWSAGDSPEAAVALREADVGFSESADDTNRYRTIGSASGAGDGDKMHMHTEARASRPEV